MSKKMTVAETARRLGISLDAAYRLVRADKLKGNRVDGRWEIPVLNVERRLKEKSACNR